MKKKVLWTALEESLLLGEIADAVEHDLKSGIISKATHLVPFQQVSLAQDALVKLQVLAKERCRWLNKNQDLKPEFLAKVQECIRTTQAEYIKTDAQKGKATEGKNQRYSDREMEEVIRMTMVLANCEYWKNSQIADIVNAVQLCLAPARRRTFKRNSFVPRPIMEAMSHGKDEPVVDKSVVEAKWIDVSAELVKAIAPHIDIRVKQHEALLEVKVQGWLETLETRLVDKTNKALAAAKVELGDFVLSQLTETEAAPAAPDASIVPVLTTPKYPAACLPPEPRAEEFLKVVIIDPLARHNFQHEIRARCAAKYKLKFVDVHKDPVVDKEYLRHIDYLIMGFVPGMRKVGLQERWENLAAATVPSYRVKSLESPTAEDYVKAIQQF